MFLEEVETKQAEMSTWPLAGLQDAGGDVYLAQTAMKHGGLCVGGNTPCARRVLLCFLSDKYLADLTRIQNVLAEVLDRQHVLKDNLVQRSRLAARLEHIYLLNL